MIDELISQIDDFKGFQRESLQVRKNITITLSILVRYTVNGGSKYQNVN